MPTLVMSTALLGSYYLGSNSGVVDFETGLPIGGLFGTYYLLNELIIISQTKTIFFQVRPLPRWECSQVRVLC